MHRYIYIYPVLYKTLEYTVNCIAIKSNYLMLYKFTFIHICTSVLKNNYNSSVGVFEFIFKKKKGKISNRVHSFEMLDGNEKKKFYN